MASQNFDSFADFNAAVRTGKLAVETPFSFDQRPFVVFYFFTSVSFIFYF